MRQSVFDGVVLSENSYTQLLCNLMGRSPDFKMKILTLLFSPDVARRSLPYALRTQATLVGSHGRPDIHLTAPGVSAIAEVKTSLRTPATDLQSLDLVTANLRGYRQFLASQKTADTWFTYLVPNGWYGIANLRRLQQINNHKDGVHLNIVTWEGVFDAIDESLRLDPFIEEFQLLLSKRFEPIRLTQREVTMLLDPSALSAVWKLTKIIHSIFEKAKSAGFQVEWERDWKGASEGFYFKKDKAYMLYFGSWLAYAAEYQALLCMGVADSWSSEVVERFSLRAPFPLVHFRDPDEWTMNSIPNDLLTSDDAASELWIVIERLLERAQHDEQPSLPS